MTQQTKISVFPQIKWISSHAAQYMNWKHNNRRPAAYIMDKDWGDPKQTQGDTYWPGVYICGVRSNDFAVRMAVDECIARIFNPFNVVFVVGLGIIQAKSAAPKDIAKSIAREAFYMAIGLLLLFLLSLIPAILIDVFYSIPKMLIHIRQWDQALNGWYDQPTTEQHLKNTKLLLEEKQEALRMFI